MKSSTFSNASNARRAARKTLAAGEAPSASFEIERIGAKDAQDARYAIVWDKLADATPVKAAKALRGGEARQTASVTAISARRRPRSANVELDAAAVAGIMPEKPVVISQANIRGQKRFDYLAERAAAGDWAAIKAYVINSNNTQAKQLKRYQARLLAYYETTRGGTTG